MDTPTGTAMINEAQPRHFSPGEGKVYTIGRMTMTFTTTAEHNLGGYTLCEAIEPPAVRCHASSPPDMR